MEFIDLKTQYKVLKETIDWRIAAVLQHGQFIMGPEVRELEQALERRTGSKHCIACASGTDALMIALMALNVGPGDEVITSPFTFIATAEMIALVGATPVFVDIDPETYNLDPNLLKKAITVKTKAIMPVSLYGQCAEMDEINLIAGEIPVIEDAAQSFGATYKGRQSCNLSTIGCTSFFPSKPLGCYGDGGACFTNDDALAARMRQIRVHGQDRRYHHPVIGFNGRLDTLQAAILLGKLTIFDVEVKTRAEVGARYTELLSHAVKTQRILPLQYFGVCAVHGGGGKTRVGAAATAAAGHSHGGSLPDFATHATGICGAGARPGCVPKLRSSSRECDEPSHAPVS